MHSHHHHHQHHHHVSGHGNSDRTLSNIKTVLVLNLGFAVVELIGGIWTNSVSIMTDAVHDLGDSLSLGLALAIEKFARRQSSSSFSYGYQRLSLVSALLLSMFLIASSAVVLLEAVPRLLNPEQPHTGGMVGLAIMGVVVNGAAVWRMRSGQTLNERVISWHLLEDVLGWVVVLIGSVVMSIWHVPILDPILSIIFTTLILWGVWNSLRSTTRLFLQGTPVDVDTSDLLREVEALEGVSGTHDCHLWSLDGESHVLTLHVVVTPQVNLEDLKRIKSEIRAICERQGRIHLTVEFEGYDEACPNVNCTDVSRVDGKSSS